MRKHSESSSSGAMYLASLDIAVPFARHRLTDSAAAIAVEDFCWRLEYESWRASRPRWWSIRRWRRWRVEGRHLRAERARIKVLSRKSGGTHI